MRSLLESKKLPTATSPHCAQTLAYIRMPFTVLLAPGGMASGVPAGCHSSNSQSAGGAHTCAILDGGGVKCWGRGDYGQLGYDSTDNKGDAAGEMAGLSTVNLLGASAIAITAGSYHTCVILSGGGVNRWWQRAVLCHVRVECTEAKVQQARAAEADVRLW